MIFDITFFGFIITIFTGCICFFTFYKQRHDAPDPESKSGLDPKQWYYPSALFGFLFVVVPIVCWVLLFVSGLIVLKIVFSVFLAFSILLLLSICYIGETTYVSDDMFSQERVTMLLVEMFLIAGVLGDILGIIAMFR